jgi:hypothetical protein
MTQMTRTKKLQTPASGLLAMATKNSTTFPDTVKVLTTQIGSALWQKCVGRDAFSLRGTRGRVCGAPASV